jgi:hypothetical protein
MAGKRLEDVGNEAWVEDEGSSEDTEAMGTVGFLSGAGSGAGGGGAEDSMLREKTH